MYIELSDLGTNVARCGMEMIPYYSGCTIILLGVEDLAEVDK